MDWRELLLAGADLEPHSEEGFSRDEKSRWLVISIQKAVFVWRNDTMIIIEMKISSNRSRISWGIWAIKPRHKWFHHSQSRVIELLFSFYASFHLSTWQIFPLKKKKNGGPVEMTLFHNGINRDKEMIKYRGIVSRKRTRCRHCSLLSKRVSKGNRTRRICRKDFAAAISIYGKRAVGKRRRWMENKTDRYN